MKSRIMRLSAVALLAGAAVVTLVPHATSYVSTSAMVNAPLLVVRAPFDAMVVEGSAPAAAPVLAGDPLLRLAAARPDRQALAAVRAEMDAVQAEIGALAEQMRAIAAHEADLRMGLAAQDPTSQRPLQRPWQAGDVPDPGGASGAGSHARQPLDATALHVYDLVARRDALRGRLLALEDQEAILAEDLARRSTFEPTAVAAAVVRRAAPGPGEAVAAGDTLMELLDCERRFLEVSLPGHLFERIRPGDRASVLLKGASARIEGEVEAIGGGGALFDGGSLAYRPPEIGPSSVQVRIRLAPANPAMPEVAATFCDVGRAAEVRFARDRPAGLDRIVRVAHAVGEWTWGLLPELARSGAPVPEDAGVL
jgi:multidrug resistance efflux pump